MSLMEYGFIGVSIFRDPTNDSFFFGFALTPPKRGTLKRQNPHDQK